MSAKDVNEAILETAIEQLEDSSSCKIRSFSNEEVFYTVKIAEENMRSCNCTGFTWNRVSCKHMYLLKRLHKHLVIFERKYKAQIKKKSFQIRHFKAVVNNDISMIRSQLSDEQPPALEGSLSSDLDIPSLMSALSNFHQILGN